MPLASFPHIREGRRKWSIWSQSQTVLFYNVPFLVEIG